MIPSSIEMLPTLDRRAVVHELMLGERLFQPGWLDRRSETPGVVLSPTDIATIRSNSTTLSLVSATIRIATALISSHLSN